MLATIRSIWYFILPFILWMAFGLGVIIITEREALHVDINQYHHPILDVFFRYVTYLGDGLFGAIIVALGFIYRIRYGVIGLLGFAGSAIVTQLLKRQVFHDIYRPSSVFKEMGILHFVDGVDLHSKFSFPSGHATAAFATFIFLAMMSTNRWVQLTCFAIAWITAFSRVYISQHFFEDIYAGSIIGTSITMLAYHFLRTRSWGEKGFVELFERS
jgi:membrane-associated phospholipid phosphatase